MPDLHVLDAWLDAEPPALHVLDMWVMADDPAPPAPELHVIDMWVVSGDIPPIGPGGVWVNIPGQGLVKHRVRFWRAGQWV